jgi:hypothetical protein
VGETVAKLCAVFGLDPGACFLENGAWRVRQPPRPTPPVPPSPSGEGGSERSDETGGERRSDHDPGGICGSSIPGADPPAARPTSTLPHPDGGACPWARASRDPGAVCPSP